MRFAGGGDAGRTTYTARCLLLGIVSVIIFLAASCAPIGRGGGAPTDASEALAQLKVEQPGPMTGYSRESFPHWSDARENGWDAPDESCDAREAALLRDGKDVKVENKGCKITSGEWPDPKAASEQTSNARPWPPLRAAS